MDKSNRGIKELTERTNLGSDLLWHTWEGERERTGQSCYNATFGPRERAIKTTKCKWGKSSAHKNSSLLWIAFSHKGIPYPRIICVRMKRSNWFVKISFETAAVLAQKRLDGLMANQENEQWLVHACAKRKVVFARLNVRFIFVPFSWKLQLVHFLALPKVRHKCICCSIKLEIKRFPLPAWLKGLSLRVGGATFLGYWFHFRGKWLHFQKIACDFERLNRSLASLQSTAIWSVTPRKKNT